MRNPISWLLDRLWLKPSKAPDAAAHRIVCATPHAWAAEQRQAAEWMLADKGAMEPNRLYESPFTDIDDQGVGGIFTQADVQQLVQVLAEVKQCAASS